MPGFGYSSEIILIFIVALLVFGPKKLPEIGRTIGRALNEFKRATNDFKNQMETEIGTEKIKEDLLRQQKEIQDKLAKLNPVNAPAENKPETKIVTEGVYTEEGQAADNKASIPAKPAVAPEAGPPAKTDV